MALVSNGSSLVFNHTDPAYIFSPSITGTGSLHQIAGTTILTGNNDYSGDTIVDGGKLVAGADTGFSANSVAFVNSGATLSLADGVHTDVLGLFDGASGGGVVNIGTTNDNTTLYVGAAGAVDSDWQRRARVGGAALPAALCARRRRPERVRVASVPSPVLDCPRANFPCL